MQHGSEQTAREQQNDQICRPVRHVHVEPGEEKRPDEGRIPQAVAIVTVDVVDPLILRGPHPGDGRIDRLPRPHRLGQTERDELEPEMVAADQDHSEPEGECDKSLKSSRGSAG